ncbi:MAG: elongation factor G, partial [Kiritimatiellae bacterium]|nr:elongation factor G [Kiritimatiellia bacterium]
GKLVPVFACAVPREMTGVVELLEGVARLFPAPCDVPRRDAEGREIDTAPDAPFVGFVWRTVNDAFVGQLTFVRVLGGTLRSDSEVFNPVKNQKERIGSVLLLNGRKQEAVTSATAGDIVALPKLKVTAVSDTLCSPGHAVRCAPMQFPKPVIFLAVRAKSQADEDKLGVALNRVCDEDPTLHVERNRETKETVLQGLGDVHLDVAAELMKSRSNVDVTLSIPKVPYRETVTGRGEGHYKHKKQTGGRGQYGEVYLRVEPKPQGSDEWFVDAVVGGVIPGNFMPAVQKGLLEAMQAGTLAGYPVTDVKVTVYDGSYHEGDSSEISFKIAAARAFKEGMKNAKPVLLEPIMKVRVTVPEQFMGDVNGDLNHRRGRILGMENEDGMQVIIAEVPQAELFRYAAELRSMTGGQGTFEMEFCRYEQVPSHVAQKVIAEASKEKEEEE